jgi:dGTPase
VVGETVFDHEGKAPKFTGQFPVGKPGLKRQKAGAQTAMPNRFYSADDFALLDAASPRMRDEGDPRTPFAVDRDRVIFSSVFRRLQSKTQVFQSGEYDFYRTRLTHSIEVARIGRSIAEFLNATQPGLGPDFYVDPDLVEAIGLTHDIGHPPFGHIGERRLHALMADWGGFEGNAQTLRLLAERFYERPKNSRGLNPTRAFLDGVLKYKALHREACAGGESPKHHFLYDEQEYLRDFALGGQQNTQACRAQGELNDCKSLECQIMDWADDAAYCLHDVLDGVKARFITLENISHWAEGQTLNGPEKLWLAELRKLIADERLEPAFNAKIGQFIRACTLTKQEHPLAGQTQRYAWRLAVEPAIVSESEFYKKLALDVIFRSPSILQIEFKGGFIIDRLFAALSENYIEVQPPKLAFLPARWNATLRDAPTTSARARLVCDFLADLTDGAAIRLYRRLFDPAFGSITDLT